MRKILALILIISGSICIFELLITAFLPVYLTPYDYFDNFLVSDSKLGYTIKPNFYGEFKQDYHQIFTANSYGFRDKDYGPKDEHVLRILAVGDSFTFGDGVSSEATWVKQLESTLHKHGVKSEVINGGMSGYGTMQYYGVTRRLVPVYEPDIIIVMVTANDPGNDVAHEMGIYPILNPEEDSIRLWLKRHSNLAKRLWLLYLNMVRPKNSFADADNIFTGSDERTRHAYELFDEALRNINSYAKQGEIWLILTSAHPPPEDTFSRHLTALSAEEGITFFNAFRREKHVDFTPRNSAAHWSPEGHQEVGEVLAEDILHSGHVSIRRFLANKRAK